MEGYFTLPSSPMRASLEWDGHEEHFRRWAETKYEMALDADVMSALKDAVCQRLWHLLTQLTRLSAMRHDVYRRKTRVHVEAANAHVDAVVMMHAGVGTEAAALRQTGALQGQSRKRNREEDEEAMVRKKMQRREAKRLKAEQALHAAQQSALREAGSGLFSGRAPEAGLSEHEVQLQENCELLRRKLEEEREKGENPELVQRIEAMVAMKEQELAAARQAREQQAREAERQAREAEARLREAQAQAQAAQLDSDENEPEDAGPPAPEAPKMSVGVIDLLRVLQSEHFPEAPHLLGDLQLRFGE